jgi:DNA-binding PadR family transcriptional regulator
MGAPRRIDKTVRIDGGKSPVRAAVLAVLVEQPSHGWDVARRTNRRVGSLWIDPKHIYSHLGWLEQEGLVRLEQESSDRHPYRRDVYYATDEGVEAREQWLAAPLASGAVGRSDLERRLLFSTKRDVPVLLRAVAYRRAQLAGEIDENAASSTVPVSYLAAMINLQRSSVDKRLKAEMEWLAEARKELEDQRDKPSPR